MVGRGSEGVRGEQKEGGTWECKRAWALPAGSPIGCGAAACAGSSVGLSGGCQRGQPRSIQRRPFAHGSCETALESMRA
eukprot:14828910-Alexandrium_andersonii.AAC.1